MCSTCCGSWVTLPRGFGYNKPQRVCRHCLKSLEKEKQQEDEVAQQSGTLSALPSTALLASRP